MVELKKWEFVFPMNTSKKTVRESVKTFAEFTQSGKTGEYATYKAFNLTGKMFGNPSIEDGKTVATPSIIAIGRDKKEEKSDIFSGKYSLEEAAEYFENDPIYAKTENGHKYYLSKEMSANMMLYLGAAIHLC